MQFIKSLICLKGLDNSQRFIGVATVCLVSFFIFNELFLSAVLTKLVLVSLTSVCYFAAAIRRCRDAKHGARAAWVASAISLSSLIAIVFIDSGLSYIAILLPVLSSIYLFSLPSNSPQVYVLGYSGPVDLSDFSKPVMVETKPISSRIEPSLFGHVNQDDELSFSSATPGDYDRAQSLNTNTVVDQEATLAANVVAQILYGWLNQNQKLVKSGFAAIVVLVGLLLSLSPLLDSQLSITDKVENQVTPANSTVESVSIERNNLLEMPDQFYLLLDENQGLILHWKADLIRNGEVWSQATAGGDDSCQVIEFNNGDSVRTINVVVENSGNYYANFSPLDTAVVVRSLARRGNFGLCGYNFSLKGSQKALNTNPIYADFAY